MQNNDVCEGGGILLVISSKKKTNKQTEEFLYLAASCTVGPINKWLING